jgi:1A family penicillin-binding protein
VLLGSPARGPARTGVAADTAACVAAGVVLALLLGLLPLVAITALPGAVRGAIAVDVQGPDEAVWGPLAQRSTVHTSDGTQLAVLHDEVDRRVVALDDVPAHVRQAVLTAEDRRFYEHHGYDPHAIVRAFLANLQAREVRQGGSTITQQLAKQNFVGTEQSLRRKAQELAYAVHMEQTYSKDELLERYLNQTYFGAGAYGIAAAAEEFFRVRPDELTVPQAALLAGMIRSPARLDPRRWPDAAKARRDHILAGMAAEGYLRERGLAGLQATPLDPAPPLERLPLEPYFVEAVKREFLTNPAFGATRAERIDLLFSGGLQIHTTLDLRLQHVAQATVAEFFPAAEGPTGALAAVDPRSGRVLALHSGTDFAVEQFDVASQGRRQPGSAFKPFVLAAALEQGIPTDLRLPGSSTTFTIPGHTEPWRVTNYGGASYGPVDLREALVRSINTAYAQLALIVGPEAVAELAERAGIDMHAATGGDVVPAMALGGFTHGVTPLEMASAYGVFATAGTLAEPYVIERVTDPDGRVVYEHVPAPTDAVHPAVAATLVDIMQDVVRFGTGRRAQIDGWAPAGKTGTTQYHTDAWFIGFVPVLSAAVWMGHPDAQVPMGRMVGGNIPAQAWSRFMTEALADIEPTPFPEVDAGLPEMDRSRFLTVPDVVGLTEAAALEALAGAGLRGSVRTVESGGPEGTVIGQQPRAGTLATPGITVVIHVAIPPTPEEEPETELEETDLEEPRPEPVEEPTLPPIPTPTPTPSPSPTPSPTPSPSPDSVDPAPPDPTPDPDLEPEPAP